MANDIKLEVLTFGIRDSKAEPNDHSNFLPLKKIVDHDFYDLFLEYLTTIDTDLEINESQKKALRLMEKTVVANSSKRIVRGVFESGHYGFESEFENIKTRAKKKKYIDDVEKIPFYFLIYIPKDRNVGIIMLQRFGINGISTIFKTSLTNFLKNKFSKINIDFNGFVSKELAKTFIQDGGIKEIILTKYNLPSDRVDRLGLTQYQDDILAIEIRVKAKRTRWFKGLNSKIRKFVNDPNSQFFDTRDLRNIGFDGTHKVSVISKFNGNKRTIDLSDSGNIKPYYDIDTDVEKERNGHPKFDSIDQISTELLKEFSNEI